MANKTKIEIKAMIYAIFKYPFRTGTHTHTHTHIQIAFGLNFKERLRLLI